MKLAIISLIIAAIAYTPVYAEDNIAVCTAVSELAEVIMKNRQAGIDMSLMMRTVKTESGISPLTLKMIEHAYGTPRYHTEGSIKRAVQDFRNNVFLECYKVRSRQSTHQQGSTR